MAETCATCRFVHKQAPVGTYIGHLCRRHSPVAITNEQWFGNGLWPAVVAADWCGDWATKVEPEKETTYDQA